MVIAGTIENAYVVISNLLIDKIHEVDSEGNNYYVGIFEQ